MAIYVISDIHGRFNEFLKLINYCGLSLDRGDILISLGDMINRGPDSAKVVAWFMNMKTVFPNNIICLYGNHEDILLARCNGIVRDDVFYHKKIGGGATEDSYKKEFGGTLIYPKAHLDFIKSLPTYYIKDKYIFFHAGLNLSEGLASQPFRNILWDEDRFYTQDTSMFENTFIFGHTPTEDINQYYGTKGSEIWKQGNKICVDCTYSKSRKLLLYNLTDDIEHYYSFAQKKCYTKKNGVIVC